ncbi:MAG: hypothetical protein ACREDR_05055, partial [Blastocatellia bacterium]
RLVIDHISGFGIKPGEPNSRVPIGMRELLERIGRADILSCFNESATGIPFIEFMKKIGIKSLAEPDRDFAEYCLETLARGNPVNLHPAILLTEPTGEPIYYLVSIVLQNDRNGFQSMWVEATQEMIGKIRIAIAAIMARNMSHNIGSHALWHLAGILDDVRLARYESPQISAFVRYLQKRMDFIAQIATSPPSWCDAVKWGPLLDVFLLQYCLLDNLTRSHGISRERLSFQNDRESPNWPEKTDDHLTVQNEPVKPSQIQVDIPHGAIGAQAFYTILENIIRNAAKHGNKEEIEQIRNGNRKLEIKVEIVSSGNPLWDNDFHKVVIYDNLTSTREDIENLAKALESPIIDLKFGALQPINMGMKEIKISASYLRMIKQEKAERVFTELLAGDGDQPPVVSVSLTKNGRETDASTGNLTYTFYLLRPKEVLVVGVDVDDPAIRQTFTHEGIDILSSFSELRSRVERGNSLRHQVLVVYPKAVPDWPWLAKHLNSLPLRVVTVGEPVPREFERVVGEFDELEIGQSPSEFVRAVWKKWIQLCASNHKLYVRWDFAGDVDGLVQFVPEDKDYDQAAPNAVVYDHADKAKQGGEVDMEISNNKLYSSAAFHECLDDVSIRDAFKAIWEAHERGEPTSDKNSIFLYKMLEAGVLSIAILDQRIYGDRAKALKGAGTTKYSEFMTFQTAWEKRRVFLLDTDEANRNFRKLVDELRDGQFDVLVVHQGDIDEIRKTVSEAEKKDANAPGFDKLWEGLKKKANWVMVDTGRGKPDLAKNERLRWVEYSGLAETMAKRTKFELVSLLMGVRAEY